MGGGRRRSCDAVGRPRHDGVAVFARESPSALRLASEPADGVLDSRDPASKSWCPPSHSLPFDMLTAGPFDRSTGSRLTAGPFGMLTAEWPSPVRATDSPQAEGEGGVAWSEDGDATGSPFCAMEVAWSHPEGTRRAATGLALGLASEPANGASDCWSPDSKFSEPVASDGANFAFSGRLSIASCLSAGRTGGAWRRRAE